MTLFTGTDQSLRFGHREEASTRLTRDESPAEEEAEVSAAADGGGGCCCCCGWLLLPLMWAGESSPTLTMAPPSGALIFPTAGGCVEAVCRGVRWG